MKVNHFPDLIIRPAANGIIVQRQPDQHMMANVGDTFVFNDFDDFVEWSAEEMLVPDEKSAQDNVEQ